MAVLEKIRKRSLLLAIVIGGALVAFIAGDGFKAFDTIFGGDKFAMKVGDETIEYNEFSELVGIEQKKIDSDQKVDPSLVQMEVAKRLIQNKIVSQECEETGLDITNNELSQVLSANPPQEIVEYCRQTGMDPRGIYDQLKKENPNDPNVAQMKMLYEQQAKDVIPQIEVSKLQMALMSCLQVNDIDIALQEEELATYGVEMATVDYAQLTNSYKVSDNELKDAYNKFKEFFKIDTEQRRINYIKIDLDPSSKDIASANTKIEKIFEAFQAQEGIKGIRNSNDLQLTIDSLVTTNKGRNVFEVIGNKQLNKEPFYDELIAGGLNTMHKQLSQNPHDRNNYMYKVTKEVLNFPDSIGFDQVLVMGNAQRQDSVLQLLKAGMTLDSIANTKNQNIQIMKFADSQQTTPGMTFIYEDSLQNKIRANINGTDFFIWKQETDGEQPYAVYARVASKAKENVNMYSIARAHYVSNPSEATVNDLSTKLQKYINKNNTTANFKKNAKAAGYNVQEEVVDAYTSMLQLMRNPYTGQPMGGIPETRRVVKWAFSNKPGSVSQIYTTDEYLLVAAVDGVYEDYKPYNDPQVKKLLTDYVLSKKIGDDLMKKYNGKAKDIDGYAKLFTDNKLTATKDTIDVTPGAQMIDPIVAGRIAALGKNGIGKVQVVAGNGAFYAFKIVEQKEAPRKLPRLEALRQFQGKNLSQRFENFIMDSRKIKNNLLTYTAE